MARELGMLGKFLKAIGSPQLDEIRNLPRLLPPDAEYCTLGRFEVFPLNTSANPREDPLFGFRNDFRPIPNLEQYKSEFEETGILVLGGGLLQVITEKGVLWLCALQHLKEANALRHSGIVFTGPRDRLAASNQIPIEIPLGSHCETASRVTNRTFGWDAALQKHGINIYLG